MFLCSVVILRYVVVAWVLTAPPSGPKQHTSSLKGSSSLFFTIADLFTLIKKLSWWEIDVEILSKSSARYPNVLCALLVQPHQYKKIIFIQFSLFSFSSLTHSIYRMNDDDQAGRELWRGYKKIMICWRHQFLREWEDSNGVSLMMTSGGLTRCFFLWNDFDAARGDSTISENQRGDSDQQNTYMWALWNNESFSGSQLTFVGWSGNEPLWDGEVEVSHQLSSSDRSENEVGLDDG